MLYAKQERVQSNIEPWRFANGSACISVLHSDQWNWCLMSFIFSISGRALLVYLTLADLLTALGNLTGITWFIINDKLTHKTSKIMCDAHASLTFFSSISSFLWTVMIGVHLHLCLVQNKAKFARKLTGMFHFLGWILPGNVKPVKCIE